MPWIVILAGINGAGKSTAARPLLYETLKIPIFVNADAIARGLNEFEPEKVAVEAGRIMLERLDRLTELGEDFAVETTLASRTYAARIKACREQGYHASLYFFWLNSADLAVARVANRVSAGGHHIPEETIRRRYRLTVGNFLELYKPICDYWEVYDNSVGERKLIALGQGKVELYDNQEIWDTFVRSAKS